MTAASRAAGGLMPGAHASLPAGGSPGEPATSGMSALSPPGTFACEMAQAALERGVSTASPPPGTFAALEAAARVLTLSNPAAQLRGTPGGRRARRCWRCGEKGHIYAKCPLAASQEGGGEPRAGAPADASTTDTGATDLAAMAAAAATAEKRRRLARGKKADANQNLLEEGGRAAAQVLGSQPAELTLDPGAPTPPLEARVGRAQAAAMMAAAEPDAAGDVCKAVIASLDAALEAARVAMLAAHAVEGVLTMAEAGLSAAKQELANEHLMGHAKLNVILGNLADTAARFGAASYEGAAAGDYEAYCKASTAAVRRFKRVLGRTTELARTQAEAAEPPELQPAGHPSQADGDLDGEGENTQTARTTRPSGEGVPGGR